MQAKLFMAILLEALDTCWQMAIAHVYNSDCHTNTANNYLHGKVYIKWEFRGHPAVSSQIGSSI